MIYSEHQLKTALERLRAAHHETLNIEVKRVSKFSVQTLGSALSAFANLPGGGTIILGVDERNPHHIVGVTDGDALLEKVEQLAASELMNPPVETHGCVLSVEGKTVVAININETPADAKPVTFAYYAYTRQHDGNIKMSWQERQQLLRRHERPRDDAAAVPDTSTDDLDKDAVQRFVTSVKKASPVFADNTDEQILKRMNVVTKDNELTVAGLYALGTIPQQYLPRLSMTVACHTSANNAEVRATNREDLFGPIPQILDAAVEWVARNISSSLTVSTNGKADTEYEIPLVAVREVVANALVHRDLSDAASGQVVNLRLTPKGLVVSSPGGLWGIKADQQGTPRGRSAVNEYLYQICRHVHGRNGRVIEAMGTGIPTIKAALAEAGLQPPVFRDTGLTFTVIFPNHSLLSDEQLQWIAHLPAKGLTSSQKEILVKMRDAQEVDNKWYRDNTGVDSTAARQQLQKLVGLGLVTRRGERRGTRYAINDQLLH